MNIYESIKENLKESNWMTYQNQIQNTLEAAQNDLDKDRFEEFCEGVINLCQGFIEGNPYGIMDSEKTNEYKKGDTAYSVGADKKFKISLSDAVRGALDFKGIKNYSKVDDVPEDLYIKTFNTVRELMPRTISDKEIRDEISTKLSEAQLIVPESTDDGWGEDIRDLTTDFFDLTDQVDYEIKNARRGSYGIDGTEVSDLSKVFKDISDKALEISETLDSAEINYFSDEDEEEED